VAASTLNIQALDHARERLAFLRVHADVLAAFLVCLEARLEETAEAVRQATAAIDALATTGSEPPAGSMS